MDAATLGWRCPVCGRGVAPLVSVCPCKPLPSVTVHYPPSLPGTSGPVFQGGWDIPLPGGMGTYLAPGFYGSVTYRTHTDSGDAQP